MLLKGKVHVLIDALSGIPHNEAPRIAAIICITKEEASFKAPIQFKADYKNHTTFGPVYSALEGIILPCTVQPESVARLLQ